jgi:hypothetical protein
MHRPTEDPRYFFNAYATGFSGRITKPFDQLIDVQASCALPPSGGYASSRVDGFRLKEIISFSSAYTQVTGSAHDEEQAWNQVATSTIENLNIQGQVTADRVTAWMSIKRGYKTELPVFRILGCRFDNLFVSGDPVSLEFDQSIETWAEAVQKFSPYQPPKGNVIVGSAVQNVKAKGLIEPNIIDVPDFGRVILGEYLITPNARSLTMFRVEMGCGFEGSGGGGNVGGNGTQYPPYP